jgi:hypothetical protein
MHPGTITKVTGAKTREAIAVPNQTKSPEKSPAEIKSEITGD